MINKTVLKILKFIGHEHSPKHFFSQIPEIFQPTEFELNLTTDSPFQNSFAEMETIYIHVNVSGKNSLSRRFHRLINFLAQDRLPFSQRSEETSDHFIWKPFCLNTIWNSWFCLANRSVSIDNSGGRRSSFPYPSCRITFLPFPVSIRYFLSLNLPPPLPLFFHFIPIPLSHKDSPSLLSRFFLFPPLLLPSYHFPPLHCPLVCLSATVNLSLYYWVSLLPSFTSSHFSSSDVSKLSFPFACLSLFCSRFFHLIGKLAFLFFISSFPPYVHNMSWVLCCNCPIFDLSGIPFLTG